MKKYGILSTLFVVAFCLVAVVSFDEQPTVGEQTVKAVEFSHDLPSVRTGSSSVN